MKSYLFLLSPVLLVSAAFPLGAADASAPSITIQSSPLVVKNDQGERNVLPVTIRSGVLSNAVLILTSDAWPAPQSMALGNLSAGTNQIEALVPVLASAATVRASIESASGKQECGSFQLKAPRKWTVYLTQHTHTDIGYTRPQTEILPEHLRYIDYALDYCDLTDGYPADAQFRWTCETAWAVREYLQRRPAPQIERLKRRLKEGRIEVAGMLLNMSEIATESSLAASLQPLHTFKEVLGAPVRTAMQNDVNGAGWCLVDYFQDIGIRYLTMGINKTRSILPFDRPTPFWWESPSGKRILAYRSDHYMTANFWHINDGSVDRMKPDLAGYLRSLEERAYPFDRVGVQFSGYYTDNSPPSTVGCDVVKAWNERYVWPKLRLSTAHEFLEYVEKEHAADLPVHREAWPDWWTDGFGSAARETGAARETEAAMQVTQGLLAMASVLGSPIDPTLAKRIAQVQENLLFYAEHTYGAAESISDPLAENSQVQWGEKSAYVWEAVKQSNLLREEAFGLVQEYLPRSESPVIAVFNTLNWARSGVVRLFIDHEVLPPDKQSTIRDAQTGAVVPAQHLARRAEGSYWALWVNDVPPLGYRTLRVEATQIPRASEARLQPGTLVLTNRFYTLTLDSAKGGIKSILDRETGEELVDQGSSWLLGQCFYETLAADREMKPEAFKRSPAHDIKLEAGANGSIWKSLEFSAEMDGCATNKGVKVEVRLYETEKRIEFHFTLRKLPVTAPEAVYVAFPFQSPESHLVYEGQGGVVTPGKTQIPGSASDWQTLQNFVSVRGPRGQIVQGCDQAPLVQLGALNLGKWQPVTKIEKPHVYSWVMNNYWFTNFRASQEGDLRWSYYLTSSRDTTDGFATRFGWGSRVPLAARVLPKAAGKQAERPATLSALTIQAPNLLMVEARPAARGAGIIVHLREVDGKTVTLTQQNVLGWSSILGADEVSVIEEPLQEGIEQLTFRPYESRFIRLVF